MLQEEYRTDLLQMLDVLRSTWPTPPFACLSRPILGKAGVWIWTSQTKGKCIVKAAPNKDIEAVSYLSRELMIIDFLSNSGIVPPLIGEFANLNLMSGFVGRYIDNVKHDTDNIDTLAAVADVLSNLHSRTWRVPYEKLSLKVPVLFDGHGFWISGSTLVREWCNSLNTTYEGRLLSELAYHALETLEHARPRLTGQFPTSEMVLIHGDISPDQILVSLEDGRKRVYLTDFAEAVFGPVHHDLARYSIFSKLNPYQDDVLLKMYIESFAQRTDYAWDPELFNHHFQILKVLAVFDFGIVGPTAHFNMQQDPKYHATLIRMAQESVQTLETLLTTGAI